jgi:hypothetical protein
MRLAPGGFLEMQDTDCPAITQDATLDGTALGKWYEKIMEGTSVLGKDMGLAKKYKGLMEEVGFVNVEEKLFYWPINVSDYFQHPKYSRNVDTCIDMAQRPSSQETGILVPARST